ncbi:MAG: hypothetical protein LUG90_12505 [Clostridiaceae bacterium]|nr:hypothetical protein [Clostridiaceae bacterium]
MKCKNKHFEIKGFRLTNMGATLQETNLELIVTNDEIGKTITVIDGPIGLTFPADIISKYLQ